MAVKYSLEEIPNQPGKYYPRIVLTGSVRTDDVAKQIAAKSLVQPADINAVLDTLDDEIVGSLAAGNSVNLDDFIGLTLSLRLKEGVEITDPDYTLSLDDVDIHVNVSIKPNIRNGVRAQLAAAGSFEKTTSRVRSPQLKSVFDVTSGTFGSYTSGGPIKIRGVDLDLPADREDDPRNGVFFLSEGAEIRATIYINEGNTEITCMVPSLASSNVDIIVRTDYEQDQLREGRILGITPNA